jgi:hypothetical protein
VVAEAAARWPAAGLTAAQAATLANVQYAVADLGGAYLGLANPAANQIRIDDDAAMIGWSLVTGQSSLDYGQMTNDKGPMTHDGIDLLTVVMHELGHLLGHAHTADGLMAPVLSASAVAPSARGSGLSTLDSSLWTLGSSAEAVGPLGQAQWGRGLMSSAPHSSSLISDPGSRIPDLASRIPDLASRIPDLASRLDDAFADLGGDADWQDRNEETTLALLESQDDAVLAAERVRSSDEAAQARVPRRSWLQRCERERDAWFAELTNEDADL